MMVHLQKWLNTLKNNFVTKKVLTQRIYYICTIITVCPLCVPQYLSVTITWLFLPKFCAKFLWGLKVTNNSYSFSNYYWLKNLPECSFFLGVYFLLPFQIFWYFLYAMCLNLLKKCPNFSGRCKKKKAVLEY